MTEQDNTSPTDGIDPSVQANTTAVRIEKALRFLIIATVVLYIGMCGGIYYVYRGFEVNRDAICAFRTDLENRVATAKQVVLENPKGVNGQSPILLTTSIRNMERTIKAFDQVKCSSD